MWTIKIRFHQLWWALIVWQCFSFCPNLEQDYQYTITRKKMTRGEYLSFRALGDTRGFRRFVDYEHLKRHIDSHEMIQKMMYHDAYRD